MWNRSRTKLHPILISLSGVESTLPTTVLASTRHWAPRSRSAPRHARPRGQSSRTGPSVDQTETSTNRSARCRDKLAGKRKLGMKFHSIISCHFIHLRQFNQMGMIRRIIGMIFLDSVLTKQSQTFQTRSRFRASPTLPDDRTMRLWMLEDLQTDLRLRRKALQQRLPDAQEELRVNSRTRPFSRFDFF